MSVRHGVLILLASGLGLAAQDSAPAISLRSPSLPAYSPITARERASWVVGTTIGPASLAGNAITAGWDTLNNSPKEYGPHWEGYGKRFGSGLAAYGTSNVMEAAIGSLWGEDPRYHRASGETFGSRAGHVVKMTFLAQNSKGNLMPAYARYAGISGSSFLSNTWRPDSEATASSAAFRTGLGFLSRLASNALTEFWPDMHRLLSRKSRP